MIWKTSAVGDRETKEVHQPSSSSWMKIMLTRLVPLPEARTLLTKQTSVSRRLTADRACQQFIYFLPSAHRNLNACIPEESRIGGSRTIIWCFIAC